MTGKKRTSNPLALAVLTHLYEKPRHPYELATTLRERRKEASIKLNYGSLYTVIESLERDGSIRALETTREGRRPEKTVYTLTKEGEAFMFQWMRDLVGTPVKEFPRFEAALSLLPILPPDEVATLLATRAQHLKKRMEEFKREDREREQMKLPRLFAIESEFFEEMTKAELRYIEKLRHDIESDTDGFTKTWKQMRKTVLHDKKDYSFSKKE